MKVEDIQCLTSMPRSKMLRRQAGWTSWRLKVISVPVPADLSVPFPATYEQIVTGGHGPAHPLFTWVRVDDGDSASHDLGAERGVLGEGQTELSPNDKRR
eukprot:TRINITY_DN5356_c0_g1_i16.p1 TRINITY_DN5356_c0_g1~~TRINITY_DN5356_c0_g1_i16.p1  ORF type:complete len:100 (-),score=0.33 TRINITY_DN5356_c0_g1_i16:356-655(-)